jgi:hypothetical protein
MALSPIKKIFNPVLTGLGTVKEKSKFVDAPIIIGGCGRSGTTLLLSIIGAHPNIYSFPEELGVFIEWNDRVQYLWEFDKGVSEQTPRLDRFYRSILKYNIPNDVTRWCEKSPGNVRYFGDILDYFEEDVYLIHIIRDGRDVMLSEHPSKPGSYWINPERWISDVKDGLKYKDHPQVLTIKYENLILEYQTTIEKICDFVKEQCTAELDSYFEHTTVQDNSAWYDKAGKIHSKSIEKWKKEENKERVEEIMANDEVVELLDELDYL